ncbi:hypothetical protein GDO78_022377 [Eleutherodactylus coqui]|uniref:Uncharacterized protein n=1 Tax=Eleutherodactylus coqui TaxID=57060 RepID=A0A8J6BGF3_ELECQ|nr:hypothetical protein GDO78_022377 [Eleutherodactylus coqui]
MATPPQVPTAEPASQPQGSVGSTTLTLFSIHLGYLVRPNYLQEKAAATSFPGSFLGDRMPGSDPLLADTTTPPLQHRLWAHQRAPSPRIWRVSGPQKPHLLPCRGQTGAVAALYSLGGLWPQGEKKTLAAVEPDFSQFCLHFWFFMH